VYVVFTEDQQVRLSTQVYQDPYQTKTRVRTVHVDLHGDPRRRPARPPSRALAYEITTRSPGP
jgi:hypothetical protein